MAQTIELVPPVHATDVAPALVREGPYAGDVYVVFTSIDETLRAVRVARGLARAMRSRVVLIHFRAVAFAAPLEQPGGLSPVETDAFRRRLEADGGDVTVRVCLCRDVLGAIRSMLREPSLVVIGGGRHLWQTGSDRWRRVLEAQGHLVVRVDEGVRA
jgi:hypothetical protein